MNPLSESVKPGSLRARRYVMNSPLPNVKPGSLRARRYVMNPPSERKTLARSALAATR